MHRHKAMLAAVLAPLIALALVVAASPAQALGKFICGDTFAATGQYDPIKFHNQTPPTGHNHLFFGGKGAFNLSNPNAANYSDVVGSATTCDNPDDTAMYWVPALVYTSGAKAGQLVPFRQVFAYYRAWNHANTDSAKATTAYKADTRLIAGNAASTGPQDTKVVNWTCDERSTRPGPYSSIEDANCANAGGTVFLTMHVVFPTCSDGLEGTHANSDVGDTQDSSHFRYFVNGSPDKCPAGFTNKRPELKLSVKWDYQGNGQDVALVSDIMQRDMGNPVESGWTGHADFWNTWRQTGGLHNGLVGMVASCINIGTPAGWCNA